MIDVTMIQTLPVENRKKLIDYIESMPDDVKTYLRIMFQADHELVNGTKKFHEYSTIRKFLENDRYHKSENVLMVKNPDESDFQKEYCNCAFLITNSPFPNQVVRRLLSLLNAPSYDDETLIKLEVSLAELLESIESKSTYLNASDLITRFLIPHKLAAYDALREAELKLSGKFNDHSQFMKSLNECIIKLTKSENSGMNHYHLVNDIAAFIYIYFKKIGISDSYGKYHLFSRFRGYLEYVKDEDFANEVEDALESLSAQNTSITDAISSIYDKKISDAVFDPSKEEAPVISNSENSVERGNYIFFFKDMTMFFDNLSKLADHLSRLNEYEILNYFQDEAGNYGLKFYLSENDYGHLSSLDGFYFGTAYDKISKELQYIGYFKDQYYLMFKVVGKADVIYGISIIPGKNMERLKLVIRLNPKVKYAVIEEE